MIETLIGIAACIAVIVLSWLCFDLHLQLQQYKRWLKDEIEAHEKTRHHLRGAAARMRRENRERVLGIIEANRGV